MSESDACDELAADADPDEAPAAKPGKTFGARNRNIFLRTLPIFAPYKWQIIPASLFILLAGALASTVPMFTQYVIDKAIPGGSFALVAMAMAVFLGAMLLRMVSWYVGQLCLRWIEERAIYQLRSMVFSQIQQLCLRFHDKYNTGFLYDRTLGGGSAAVGAFLATFSNSVMTTFCMLFFSLGFCLYLSWEMTSWVLLMSIGYVRISKYFARTIHAQSVALNLATNEFAGKVTDLLRGVKTIKAFAMERRVAAEFDNDL